MRVFVVILFCVVIVSAHGQTLSIPAVAAGMSNNYFIAGTGDGGTLSTYNSFLRLHYGLAIGSPYVSNGSGGYVEKATISFDGRSGNISTIGNIGIGTSSPAAKLDVGAYIDGGILGTVLGRLQEGNWLGAGTFLGVRGYATQQNEYSGKGFSIEHSFYGAVNNSINFYRGGSTTGGFISFNTDNNSEKMRILNDGNVGIGTTDPKSFKLAVNGKVWATEVQVTLTNPGPDYVFEETYNLPSLTDTENYIKQNKHLPEVPSACEMEENGINLSEMNMILLKKVEELTLYVIELKKENVEIKKLINEKQ